jgi:hypothetical protein
MTKPEMVAFIDRYLTYNSSVDLKQLTGKSDFPHPPSETEWDLLIEELEAKGHLNTHGNGNHFLTSPIKPTSHKQELLMYLYNSDKSMTDIKPLLKSINISRQEIIDLLRDLEGTKENPLIIESDRQWRPFTGSRGGALQLIDELPFNFRLTPQGRQFVADKYLSKPSIHVEQLNTGDIFGGDKIGGDKVIGDKVQGSSFRDFKSTINPPIVDTVQPMLAATKTLLSRTVNWMLEHIIATIITGLIIAFIVFRLGWTG